MKCAEALANGGQSAQVVNALQRWNSPKRDERAREWSRRIEAIRKSYLSSEATLQGFAMGETRNDLAPTYQEARRKPLNQIVMASKPAHWAQLLYALCNEIQPRVSVELGTCVGISASYLSAAISRPDAIIYTIEGASAYSAQARETLRTLNLEERVRYEVGLIHERLPEVLAREVSVDFDFVDGHHADLPTVQYFNRIADKMPRGGVMLLDDIRWSEGMLNAWNKVRVDPRVRLSVDLGHLGICVLGEGQGRVDLVWPVEQPTNWLKQARRIIAHVPGARPLYRWLRGVL